MLIALKTNFKHFFSKYPNFKTISKIDTHVNLTFIFIFLCLLQQLRKVDNYTITNDVQTGLADDSRW